MNVPVSEPRTFTVSRQTKETQIEVNLNLDGGEVSVSTGIGFFDHMLTALAFYAGFGLQLTAKGDLEVDGHHTVEDTGIVLGDALKGALGDRKGIRRYGTAFVPMDEALCRTVLDLSNRPMIGAYDSCLTKEFMRAFAVHGGITLHQSCLYGENAHHITEALFKSLGMALKEAVQITGSAVPSTKGAI